MLEDEIILKINAAGIASNLPRNPFLLMDQNGSGENA